MPGQPVTYYDPQRDIKVPAQVIKIHYDSGDPPYVTLRFSNGQERQTTLDRIMGPQGIPGSASAAPVAPPVPAVDRECALAIVCCQRFY
jgi:hypothetical protein